MISNLATTTELPVMESFYTLQGEGYYSGHAAYFIRLAGCDVGCVWCDVKESWDAANHSVENVESLIEKVLEHPARLVVITGGEPLIYNLNELCKQLKAANIRTHIETSGVHPVSGKWDWICFSPKKFKEPLPEIFDLAHELKIIINHLSDFDFAEKYASLVNSDCKLFLQPEWSKSERFIPKIVEYVKEYPKWQLSLQTHKFLQIP